MAQKISCCVAVLVNERWFKVSNARHAVNEGAQFSENAL